MAHPKTRWLVAGLIFLASVLNYVDRQTLSLLAPTIQASLHLDDIAYARVLNCFLVAYTLAYLLSGPLVDRVGVRVGFLLFVGWWSVANLLTGFARSFSSLAIFRGLLGLGEAGNWVAAPRAVAEFFPPGERALAIGLYTLGGTIGATIAPQIVVPFAAAYGWPSAFFVTGAAGLFWLLPWWWLYGAARRSLAATSTLSPDHPALAAPSSSAPALQWWRLLLLKEVWLLMLARLLTDPVWFFFQFWFAKYLHDARGLSQAQLSITWLIFLAADLGGVTGGWLSGLLIRRHRSPPSSRLFVMLGCALLIPLAAAIPGAAGLPLVLALGMIVVLAHMGWLINLSALVVDLAPPSRLGAVFGLVAAGSSAGGILMNQQVGELVTHHSYDAAFYVMAGLHPLVWCLLWPLRRSRESQRLTAAALAPA